MIRKEDVAALYIALFNRAPEGEGLNYWYQMALENQWGLAEIAENMFIAVQELLKQNPEYIDIYPQYANIDPQDYNSVFSIVETIYKNVFNKDSSVDFEGINYWVNQVLSGNLTLGNLAANIIYVAMNTDWSSDPEAYKAYLTFINRIEAAIYVAETIQTFDGDFQKFQNYILQVTDDKASLENVKTLIENEINSMNEVLGNPSGGSSEEDVGGVSTEDLGDLPETTSITEVVGEGSEIINTEGTAVTSDIENFPSDGLPTIDDVITNSASGISEGDSSPGGVSTEDLGDLPETTSITEVVGEGSEIVDTEGTAVTSDTENLPSDGLPTTDDVILSDNPSTRPSMEIVDANTTIPEPPPASADFYDGTAFAIPYDNNPLITLNDQTAYIVDSLVYGYKWNLDTITYSFPTTMPEEYLTYVATDTSLFPSVDYFTLSWEPFDNLEIDLTNQIFSNLENIINLDFQNVQNEDGIIRLSNVSINNDYMIGFSFYPSLTEIGGDIFIDKADITTQEELYTALMHEIGHSLGLDHPFDGNVQLSINEDNTLYTVMSYNLYKSWVISIDTNVDGSILVNFDPIAIPESFQMYDILALQALYGANDTASAGNDIYYLSNLYNDHKYFTLWDSGGIDTIDVSQVNGQSFINLNEGSFSSVDFHTLEDLRGEVFQELILKGVSEIYADTLSRDIVYSEYSEEFYTGENNLAIAYGTIIENVITGSGNDAIVDNLADNQIITNAGDDYIYLFFGGNDFVDGGDGYDYVYFTGSSTEYELREDITGYYVKNLATGEIDLLVNVEEIVFDDTNLIL